MRVQVKDKIKANDLLREHLVKHDEGDYSYINGMSDEKIASAVGNGMTKKNVQYLRQQVYGELRRQSGKRDLEAEVDRLRKHLNDLCVSLGYGRCD